MTTSETVAPVVRTVHVKRGAQDAFRVFTEQIGSWWPLQEFGVYMKSTAGLAFEDNRLVERSTAGEQDVWGTVTRWDPPDGMAMTWHPGGDADTHTTVEVTFTAEGDGTRVDLVHHGWDAWAKQAQEYRSSYEQGWPSVLAAFAKLADGEG